MMMATIVNQTHYNPRLVRAMVRRALREAEVDDYVLSVRVAHHTGLYAWRGRYYSGRRHVVVRVAKQFPAQCDVYQRRDVPEAPLFTRWEEALAWGLGHELEHARQHRSGQSYRESETEWAAHRMWSSIARGGGACDADRSWIGRQLSGQAATRRDPRCLPEHHQEPRPQGDRSEEMMSLDHEPESFFYAPSGYRDADMEMAELEAEGSRRYRLMKWATGDQKTALETGETVERQARNRDTGLTYMALTRLDLETYTLRYSVDAGATWHPTMSNARKSASVSS